MLIEAGVDIYTVSRLLGHADVRITQEVYAPLSGRFLAEQAAKLGRHIGPSLVREVPSVPSLRTAVGSVDP
jgi:integrase